jgi:hypothetical protein
VLLQPPKILKQSHIAGRIAWSDAKVLQLH